MLGATLLLLLLPGAAAARWLGLRADRSIGSVFLPIGLSLALSPVIVFWTALAAGFERLPVSLGLGGATLLVAGLARLRPSDEPFVAGPLLSGRRRWLFAGVLGGMAALVALPFLQVTTASGAFLASPITDWPKHFAVAWLIERTGVPPRNLLYPPQADQSFVYYYFFHLLVAGLRLLSGNALSILGAFVTVTVIALTAFLGLFAMLARRILGNERAALLSLLFVTVIGGLDVLSVAGQVILRVVRDGRPLAELLAAETLTGWSSCLSNVHDMYSHAVWAPHHLAGAAVFLLILVLWATLGRRLRFAIVLPLLLSSLLGFSAYVFVPVAATLCLFALHDTLSQAGHPVLISQVKSILGWGAIGLVWLVVSFPMLSDLWQARAVPGVGLALQVAFNGINWRQGAFVNVVIGRQPLGRLLDAPLFFALELGAVLFLGGAGYWVIWRRCRARLAATTPPTRCELANWLAIAGGVAFVLSLFIVSKGSLQALTCNDFRMRGLIPLQIALACFAGLGLSMAMRKWRRPMHLVLIALVLLGVLTTAWNLRGWAIARFVTGRGLPAEAMNAYRYLRESTPQTAVVQGSARLEVLRDQPILVYGERISRVAPGLWPVLQVSSDSLRADAAELTRAFASREPAETWNVLRSLGVDYVFVGPEERRDYGVDGELPQLRNPAYFEPVYEAGSYTVFRVKSVGSFN